MSQIKDYLPEKTYMKSESQRLKCSRELENLLYRVKGLEETEYELKRIRATLEVNFGKTGKIAQLWGNEDSTTSYMLNTVLSHLIARKLKEKKS